MNSGCAESTLTDRNVELLSYYVGFRKEMFDNLFCDYNLFIYFMK